MLRGVAAGNGPVPSAASAIISWARARVKSLTCCSSSRICSQSERMWASASPCFPPLSRAYVGCLPCCPAWDRGRATGGLPGAWFTPRRVAVLQDPLLDLAVRQDTGHELTQLLLTRI